MKPKPIIKTFMFATFFLTLTSACATTEKTSSTVTVFDLEGNEVARIVGDKTMSSFLGNLAQKHGRTNKTPQGVNNLVSDAL